MDERQVVWGAEECVRIEGEGETKGQGYLEKEWAREENVARSERRVCTD